MTNLLTHAQRLVTQLVRLLLNIENTYNSTHDNIYYFTINYFTFLSGEELGVRFFIPQ